MSDGARHALGWVVRLCTCAPLGWVITNATTDRMDADHDAPVTPGRLAERHTGRHLHG